MQPIETRYQGYRFRSRLEARWAVAFNAMGWTWEYEPEGYVTCNHFDDKPWITTSCYLPDFRVSIPDLDQSPRWLWEVKPPPVLAGLSMFDKEAIATDDGWCEPEARPIQKGLCAICHGGPPAGSGLIVLGEVGGPMATVMFYKGTWTARTGPCLGRLTTSAIHAARAARFGT